MQSRFLNITQQINAISAKDLSDFYTICEQIHEGSIEVSDAQNFISVLPRPIAKLIKDIQVERENVLTIVKEQKNNPGMEDVLPEIIKYIPTDLNILTLQSINKLKYLRETGEKFSIETCPDVDDHIFGPISLLSDAMLSQYHNASGLTVSLDSVNNRLDKELTTSREQGGYYEVQKKLAVNSTEFTTIKNSNLDALTVKSETERLIGERKKLIEQVAKISTEIQENEIIYKANQEKSALRVVADKQEDANYNELLDDVKLARLEKLCNKTKKDLEEYILNQLAIHHSDLYYAVQLTRPYYSAHQTGYSALAEEVVKAKNDNRKSIVSGACEKALIQYYAIDEMQKNLSPQIKTSSKQKLAASSAAFERFYSHLTCRMDSSISHFVKNVLNILSFGKFREKLFAPSTSQLFANRVRATFFAQPVVQTESSKVKEHEQVDRQFKTVGMVV